MLKAHIYMIWHADDKRLVHALLSEHWPFLFFTVLAFYQGRLNFVAPLGQVIISSVNLETLRSSL